MIRYILLLLTTAAALSVYAESAELKAALRELDQAMANGQEYIDEKEKKLASLKMLYAKASTDEIAYNYLVLIADEYQAYDNDSALTYMNKCLVLAEKMQQKELMNASSISIIHQYAVSGYYDDANRFLENIDNVHMHGKLLEKYYSTLNHLYGEMSFYCKDEKLKKEYIDLAAHYKDSLMQVLTPNTTLFLQKKQAQCVADGNLSEAMKYSDMWMKTTPEDCNDYPMMAYFRAELFEKMGKRDEQKLWLVRSAIKDVECARMNQASLWSLASILNEEGETRLSHQYIKYSWQCISRFSTHMRGWLVAPIMESIDRNYRLLLDRERYYACGGFGIVSVLTIMLLIAVRSLKKKNRQLTSAHEKLDALNKELVAFNEKLGSVNLHLADANRVKEKYIGAFISLCMQYIEKLDNLRIKVNRKLKVGQVADVMTMTSSNKLKKEELDKLHEYFDDIFLTLFPTFIDDFNSLLQPDSKIQVADKGTLNTELRIFALVRLGIDDSASIAQFLHYSPNSIYCYRARTKNKAVGNRDEFETKVKGIGVSV